MDARYRIVVRPQVGSMVTDVFPSIVAAHSDDTTTLEGPVVDQAQLHGVLRVIHDLNATIVSVTTTDPAGAANALESGFTRGER